MPKVGAVDVNGNPVEPMFAMAVRDGDVLAVAQVPEPTSLALFCVALVGLASSRCKRNT